MADLRKTFSKIYDQNIDKIYRFIFLKVNAQEIAEDLTSETFLKGWEAFKGQKKIENPRAFLYRIARNLVIDYYREKGKNKVISAEDIRIIDPRTDLEGQAALMSDFENIKSVLTKLNDDYQNALIWRYLDDLSISEIARLLDRTEDATRVLLHRALKSLRQSIDLRKMVKNSS
jgi:RNA polymerase sigma-70 factor (ECF subfamily)